jgi:hypothetical protein
MSIRKGRFPMHRFIVFISIILLLGGCAKTRPIYDVERAEIFTGSGKEPSQTQVRKAIVQAVVSKTWRIKEIDSGHIEASLSKKSKVARITIRYNTNYYSIIYKNSSQLLYNEGRIHRRYNSWIKGLQITIDGHLAQL